MSVSSSYAGPQPTIRRLRLLRIVAAVAILSVFPVSSLRAQFPYPGQQSPYPRDPRYPGRRDGGGIHLPRRGSESPSEEEVRQYSGIVRSRSEDSITIEAQDTRIIDFRCSERTRYLQNGEGIQADVLKPGDEVNIEGRQDGESFFHAITVNLVKQAAASAASQPSEPEPVPVEEAPNTFVTPPPAAPDPDDPGRPMLRRGKPEPRVPSVPEGVPSVQEREPPAQTAVPSDSAPSEEEVFLATAREAALEFSGALPNYICRQMTARYQSEGQPAKWQALDVVTAAVVYEGGKESYQDIRINNRPTDKPMMEISGSRSRGEYGSTLRDLFSPSTAASFSYRRQSTAAGRSASIYDFQVDQPHSHWRNQVGGQSVFPAYRGSVWIDRETRRVLRIEMQARNIPEEFPVDKVEWIVDYEYVRIGGDSYLLPVHAENLGCFRSSTQCVRNATDFRNYRMFTSESQIMATDSVISFEGEEKEDETAAEDQENEP